MKVIDAESLKMCKKSKKKKTVKKVKKTKRPMVITQHGRSSAVLLDVEEYDSLIEKIEIFQDIHLAEKQFNKGQSIDHDDVKDKIYETFKK